MHTAAFRAVEDFLRSVKPPQFVVEFGSRNVNGSVRPLFQRATVYVGVDVVPGQGVDVVMDAADFDHPNEADCVVCCEVLEHAANAKEIVVNAVDVLAPGGAVIVTCASDGRAPHSAVDGGPLRDGEFYENVSPLTLLAWLEGAGAERVKVMHNKACGDAYAIGFKP